MEKLVLIFLAFGFLLRPETNTGTIIRDNRSAVYVGIYTGHIFSDNIDTPTFRSDDYDHPDIALTESPVKRYTETTKNELKDTGPVDKTRTMYHLYIYDLPPPNSHC